MTGERRVGRRINVALTGADQRVAPVNPNRRRLEFSGTYNTPLTVSIGNPTTGEVDYIIPPNFPPYAVDYRDVGEYITGAVHVNGTGGEQLVMVEVSAVVGG